MFFFVIRAEDRESVEKACAYEYTRALIFGETMKKIDGLPVCEYVGHAVDPGAVQLICQIASTQYQYRHCTRIFAYDPDTIRDGLRLGDQSFKSQDS